MLCIPLRNCANSQEQRELIETILNGEDKPYTIMPIIPKSKSPFINYGYKSDDPYSENTEGSLIFDNEVVRINNTNYTYHIRYVNTREQIIWEIQEVLNNAHKGVYSSDSFQMSYRFNRGFESKSIVYKELNTVKDYEKSGYKIYCHPSMFGYGPSTEVRSIEYEGAIFNLNPFVGDARVICIDPTKPFIRFFPYSKPHTIARKGNTITLNLNMGYYVGEKAIIQLYVNDFYEIRKQWEQEEPQFIEGEENEHGYIRTLLEYLTAR